MSLCDAIYDNNNDNLVNIGSDSGHSTHTYMCECVYEGSRTSNAYAYALLVRMRA